MRIPLVLLCYLLLVSSTVFAEATTNIALQSAQRQLQQLDPKDEGDKALREIYLQVVDTYSQIDSMHSQISSFKASLQSLPKNISQLKKQLTQELPTKNLAPIKSQPLPAFERDLTQLQASQLELQRNRDKIENEINSYDQKPIQLRQILTELKKTTDDQQNNSPTKAQRLLNEARFSFNNLQRQAINLELLFIPLQSKFDRLKLNWTEAELKRLSAKIRLYQDEIQRLRQVAADKLLTDTAPANRQKNNPPAITSLIEKNKQLSEKLRSIVASATTTITRLRILEQQYSLIQQSYKVIQQQLLLSENSYGVDLRRFSQRFSTPQISSRTNTQISRIRLNNIELNQLKLDMAVAPPDTSAWTTDSIEDLQGLQASHLELIDNLHSAYSRELDGLSKILTLESQIKQQYKQGELLLTEYLIWLPSVPAIDFSWPQHLIDGTQEQLARGAKNFNSLQIKPFQQWARWLVIYVIISALMLLLLKYQYRHEKIWSRQVGNVINDRFSRSVRLVFLAPIVCLPLPLLVYLFLHKIVTGISSDTQQINDIFCLSLWLYLTFMCWLRRPYGLLISHLDVPEDFCVKLKKIFMPCYVLATPTVWLLIYFDHTPAQDLHAGIVRLLFMVTAILAGCFWGALWKVSPHVNPHEKKISWWQQSKLWLISLIAVHCLLVIAGLFGYLFGGLIVMFILLAVTLVLSTVFLIYRLGVRWLLIAERRISFDKARARRSEILAAREKNEEMPILEENYLGQKSVSEQGSVILKALCIGLLFVGLYLLVKNFLPSLDVLDKVILWSNDVTTASGVISESVSLRSVITSFFVIGLTILAAYNLPGLFELLILRHINLTPGTCYAITTITRYLLILICFLAASSQIGVEWAKLQWLIAAMGVGLGFGLQEIVANFVSGIIILFEKPVRIGDTVTISGLTGTVTKIKIRATTIVDWDRKEVIIPNKTFITDQLINWSLSDAITRLILKEGVAHGSDTQLIHKLIKEISHANPRVLASPAPEVIFMALGHSTLDFELRYFVDNVGNRNSSINELNQQIDQLFKERGITIALPQMDVHLHPARPLKKQ